jgi:tetratricopeptide (TPR) repeat protein
MAILPSVVTLLATAVLVAGRAQTVQRAPAASQMSTGVLAIVSDRDGALFVDGERKIALTSGKITTLKLAAGQHFVDLRTPNGSKLWEKIVPVPAGAQVAERIEIRSEPKPTDASASVKATEDLTACEELDLLGRWRESAAACKRSTNPYDAISSLVSIASVMEAHGDPKKSEFCIDASQSEQPRRLASLIPCADSLYGYGDHQRALAMLNEYLNDNRSTKMANLDSAYFLRAEVKFALSDTDGSLADFDSGFRIVAATPLEKSTDPYLATKGRPSTTLFPYLRRAVILYRIGNYRQAISDFNDYAAAATQLDQHAPISTNKKLGDLIRHALASNVPLPVAAPNNPPDIQTSVARIEQSQHVTLPPLQAGSGTRPLIIQNDTSSVLTVYLSGPTAQKQVIQPHVRVPVRLPPGVYKLAGELADKSVLPFFALRTYSGGEN